ncbi:MAG: ribonuclease P protein component [Bacillota bacterium]
MAKILTLKRNHQFLRAYKKGKFFVGRLMVIYVLKNHISSNQIGISASKKVGKSVKRNRVKRLIKESYRGYQECVPQGYDIAVVARTTDPMPTFKEVAKEMKFLLKKLGMFSVEKWESLKKD